MQSLEQNNAPRSLSVGGCQVAVTERIADNGYRFEFRMALEAPPGLLGQIQRATEQWCRQLVNSHPDITARSWIDDRQTVFVEAQGNTEIIGHFTESLWNGVSESDVPASARERVLRDAVGTLGGAPAGSLTA